MDQAAITKALTEACAIIDEALPLELSAGARNHSAADRTELRKTALKVILETLLQPPRDLTRENDDDNDVLLTPGQVAVIFAVSTREVAEYADWGILNPVFTPGGKRLYRESEVRSVLAMSPEERNARRNPVTDASGEDIERMRTDEGLTWSQIIRRTGLGRTTLTTRHGKWLFERAEAADRDEEGHSAGSPHAPEASAMEDVARMRTQERLSWREIAVKTGLSRTTAQRTFAQWAARQLAGTEGPDDSQPAR